MFQPCAETFLFFVKMLFSGDFVLKEMSENPVIFLFSNRLYLPRSFPKFSDKKLFFVKNAIEIKLDYPDKGK